MPSILYLQLLFVLTITLINKATAQSYYFRHYQVENGLSNNSVFSNVQDKAGFLWFGTKDGLNRFDGYHFKTFTLNDSGHNMMPDIVSCLLVNDQDVLFVGCQKGLYTFNKEKECLEKLIDSLSWINAMHFDKSGQLWFISAITLCRYNFKTKTVKQFPPGKFFNATTICTSDDGQLWVGTADGFLEKFDAETETFSRYNMFAHSPQPASYWIQKIHSAGTNALYVGTSNQGLKKFDIVSSGYQDVLTYNPDKTTVYVRDIAQYSANEYWFATESGIFILNTITGKFDNLKKKFLDPYSLTDNAVYTLCKDNEGGIWVGTYFGGINYYSKQYSTFQKYFPDNSTSSISGNAVREICEDNDGNLWIGTEDAGLNKLNPVTGEITQFKPSGERNQIAYTNIHGLMVSDNDLWIGTFEHGLDIMDIKTGKVKQHYIAGPGKKELKSNFAVSLLKTRSGEIYVGSGNSLFRYDQKSKGFDEVTEVAQHIFVACLTEAHDNTIWVGTHGNGVFYFNPVTKESGHFDSDAKDQNSLTNNVINAIYEDSKNNIWVSTEGGGLCKLNPDRKTFSAITTKEGLPSNFTFKVLEDDKQHLWITTSRGLVNFDPATKNVIVYTKDNGLLNDQFNYNSGFKDAAGKMYFGSVRGMITFNPEDLSKTIITPPVYITGFQVQNKELKIDKDSSYLKKSIIYTDHITLPYDRSSFSIDFAALSYIAPEMTEYSYIMKGIDKEWTVIKPNRKIYFTNLSPGTYLFKLKAAVNGKQTTKERQLLIKILPPFWATWWAYMIYALLTIALTYYLLRSYNIILEDKKEKEIYEAKIEFFTNVAHEIRTPLTLIKGPVENLQEIADELPQIKEDVVTMERNTNRLIALITQILDFRQTETKGFSIDFEKVNISELLNESFVNFSSLAKKKNLSYLINLPATDVFAHADEEALNKIFSNLINNAVKYANKIVNVRLVLPPNNLAELVIEFENDGTLIPEELKEKVFEPFYRLKESVKQQGTGIGLTLARSLTELHKGKLYVKDSTEGLNIFVLCLPLHPAGDLLVNKKKYKRLLKLK
ncbi:hybrid sensor histidine kinase/response regulator transcription factor [soil metagenome]